jgi:oligopeptide/dipeptide ABC transporter ATP-binding protein
MSGKTLEIRHLNTSFFTQKGEVGAAKDICLEVRPGQIVGIVGESGCGKSVTARSVMGLVKYPGRVVSGEILLNGTRITGISKKEACSLRGSEVSMIFQEPMTSLNPVIKVGRQVEEVLLIHKKITKKEAKKEAAKILEAVGISDVASRMECYPHQLSGGLRQRVMIAMAMICSPSLLIADEPTTALDVTVEAQILRLMKKLCEAGTSILLISHNLGVIAQVCDYVYVMYAGRIVEQGETFTLFDHPAHPYTRGLLGAAKSLRSDAGLLKTIPGVVPNLLHLPAGCSFSPRCDSCMDICRSEMPDMLPAGEKGHLTRCWRS